MIPILLVALLPQQIDAVHYMDSRRSDALFSRVENAAELREFQRIGKTNNPVDKRALTEAFLTGHPASWLLTGVYQAAASASLELRDPARALEEGRASLRLLPENAPLLAVMAQVESSRGERMQAVRDARDALLWLNLFAPPAGVKDSAGGACGSRREGAGFRGSPRPRRRSRVRRFRGVQRLPSSGV